MSKIKSYYEELACKYDENCLNEKYYKETNFHNLLRWTSPCHKKILDLGCGTGRFTKYLASMSRDVTGIDFSREMIRIAQRNTDFESYVMKMDELEYRANQFDLVTAVGSLEYHDLLMPVLAEVRRVLKSGGKFYFNIHRRTPHVQILRRLKTKTRDWEYNLYSYRQIWEMLSALGFTIDMCQPTYFLPMQFNSPDRDKKLAKIPIINHFSAMFIIGATICK